MNLDIAGLKQQWMLPQLLNSGLESVLNYLIGRTAYCAPYLRKLAGKSLQVKVKNMDITLFFVFSESRVDILQQYETTPDCAVTLSLKLLFTPLKKSQISQWILF